ncbi:nickel-dependent lactate racemase [Sporolituus thermophilus]|uniref:Nickel-dependent lactate racemase n=1 Tax=Sporolituus thermophilus DSM 23256 TaxID=1123285 RepID=A0A1G7HIN1_9FIRM|nr:nickel-dependent lactate racemase [Sporolituus thermophilus]SDF00124.1 Nickel-dependent lactate racemase [Sporolituus thermophilus DSM 23256]
MALKQYTFKYGRGKVNFAVDSDLVIGELTIKDMPVLADPAAAILEAIRNPIGAKPLREIVKPGETVAFIVNDPTRVANSHVFMPLLLNELNAVGVPDQDMFVIFSLGTHRLMTEEEMVEAVGPEVAKRVRMYNSDCRDESQFKYFGTTSRGTPVYFHKLVAEADHIVCTGSVVHHFFAGYGGGRKAMLPGVALYETIRKNHSMIFDPNAVIGRLHGNPVYEDQVEGVEMCRPSFLLNVVLNEKKEFLKVFAGDYIQAHLEACKFVDEVYGVKVEKEADLVIASCGGYPKDINVYQLQKTMDNAWCAVREGGVVIILGECEEGSGSALYEKTMQQHRTPQAVEEALRANFQIGAHKAYAVTRLMKKAEFILVSGLDPELARTLLFTPAKDIDEALQMAYAKLGPRPSITLMPQGSLTVPLAAAHCK